LLKYGFEGYSICNGSEAKTGLLWARFNFAVIGDQVVFNISFPEFEASIRDVEVGIGLFVYPFKFGWVLFTSSGMPA